MDKVLPVHILYHDQILIEQPLSNQLVNLAKELSTDLPIRLSMIRMSLVLDVLSDPADFVKKLEPKHRGQFFRADFRSAFANIALDYKLLRETYHKEVFEPEVLIFLKTLPTQETNWVKIWQTIQEYKTTTIIYWISQTHLQHDLKKNIDSVLSHFCPRNRYSIIEPPATNDLDFLLQEKLSKLKSRIQAKITSIQSTKSESVRGATPATKWQAENQRPESALSSQTVSLAKANNQQQLESHAVPKNNADTTPDAMAATQPLPLPVESDENKAAANQPEEAKAPPPPPKVLQPAEWQMKEPPPELTDRQPHTAVDERTYSEWYMAGASRRGKMHEHEGTFREDAFSIETAGGWLLTAVADGAGSHYLSRVGSNLAVKSAVEAMQKIVEEEQPSKPTAQVALQEALETAWKSLYTEAEKRKVAFKDLSTTLLLLMFHPRKNLVGVAQVGDGLIAAQLENGQIALLGKPESGEYSGQTYFLTNHKVEELASKVETPEAPGPIQLFLVMTDGVADDLYPPKERLPILIKPMPATLAAENPPQALLDLINYDRPGSFDDRTLVVLCRREKVITAAQPVAIAAPAAEEKASTGQDAQTDQTQHPHEADPVQ